MLKQINRKPVFSAIGVLLVLLAVITLLSGCSTARGAVARGWAGGVVADDILFIGSMQGNLVSVNTTDGWLMMTVPLESQEASTGFLSCAQGSSAVAIYGSPTIAGDLVCVGGYNGKIYAFSREEMREEPRWVYPRQDTIGGSVIGSLVYDQGKLYFGAANNKVFALDAADGYKEWDVELGDMIWSTPAVSGDSLYIGCFDQKLYALDTADGSTRWEFETEGAIVSSPVVSGNTVYIGSFDRYLYALDAATGNLKWKFMADNWFWASLLVHNNRIYAPCLDGKIYVLDTADGTVIAEYNLEDPVSASPVIIGDTIVAVTQQGDIYAMDTARDMYDKLASLEEAVFAPLIAGNGKVFVHTNLDTLYEVDARTGAKREIDIKEEETE